MIRALMRVRLNSVFLSTFRSKKKKNKPDDDISPATIVGYAIAYLALAAIFFAFVSIFAYSYGSVLIPMGAVDAYFGIFILASLSIIFILSIFETKAELFECKDNELLLSMPIPERAIIISRIAVILLYNYLFEAIIMIPVFVVYAIYGFHILGLLGSIIIFITIPLLATSLSAGVGYLVALITKRIKNKSLITVLLSLAFMLAYFVGYSSFMNSSLFNGTEEEMAASMAALLPGMKPIAWVGAAQRMSILPLMLIVSVTAVISAVAYLFIARHYIAIITDTSTGKKKVYKERLEKQRSPIFAIARKEFAKIASSPTYMLNAGFGVIFPPLLAGFAIFKADALRALLRDWLSVPGVHISLVVAPLVITIMLFSSSMVFFAASAISLEGKYLWNLRSMPLRARDIIIGKTIPQIIISATSCIIGGIVVAIITEAKIIVWLSYILLPLLMNIFLAFAHILLNVAMPKFEFSNETQPVKQSLPVFIAMLMAFILPISVGAFALNLGIFGLSYVFLGGFSLIMIAASIGMYALISTVASRKIDNIQL